MDWDDDDSVVDGLQTDAGWTISYLDVLLVMVTMFAVLLTLNFLQVAEVAPASGTPDSLESDRLDISVSGLDAGRANGIAPPPVNVLTETLLPAMVTGPGLLQWSEAPASAGFLTDGFLIDGFLSDGPDAIGSLGDGFLAEEPIFEGILSQGGPFEGPLSEDLDSGSPHMGRLAETGDVRHASDVSLIDVESVESASPLALGTPDVSSGRESAQSQMEDARADRSAGPSAAVLALASRLTAEMGNRDFEVILEENQFRIELQDRILFPSGQAELNPSGLRVLADLAPWLEESGMVLTVEGHTDDRPIATARFPSNWELSSLRATTVARQLIAAGVPADRIRVMGYADTRPRVPNDSADQRALNRRVTLVVEAPVETSRLGPPSAGLADDLGG